MEHLQEASTKPKALTKANFQLSFIFVVDNISVRSGGLLPETLTFSRNRKLLQLPFVKSSSPTNNPTLLTTPIPLPLLSFCYNLLSLCLL